MFNFFNKNNNDKKETIEESSIDKNFVQKLKEEPFIQAIKNNDKEKLTDLMENKWDEINQPEFYGMTLLYYAVLFDNWDMTMFLLEKGASITIKNKDKLTWDHEIERVCYYTGDGILNIATASEERVLNKYQRFRDKQGGKTPFDLATGNDNKDVLKLFIANNPNNKELQKCFLQSNISDNELIDLLIKYNQSNTKLLDSLLKKYSKNQKIKSILNRAYNSNPNNYKDGATLLYHAILDKNFEQTKLLLKSGADINLKNSDDISYDDVKLEWYRDRDKTPIEASVYAGDLDILNLIMEYNPNIDTIFRLAVSEEKSEIVELLIKKGANLNIIKNADGDKFVPLKLACEKQNLKIVKILIENGADTNIAGYEGRTALFDAIEATRANKEIISYLIKNSADIHKEDDKGITPLSFAQTNKKSLVKVLIEYEEETLSENQDSKISANYQILSDKILLQNKVINQLKDEIRTIKNSGEDNHIKELKLQIDDLREIILFQSNEIQELQNQLVPKEEDTKTLIDSFTIKINELEKKFDKQKIIKTKIPVNIPVEKHSINKDDGVIVKRESFDGF